jgi:phage FluMu gp28-like protein
MDNSKYLESLERLSGDQNRRESRLLAELLGEAGYADLAAYEANLAEQQSRLLFSIQAEIEDTEMALRQSEQLAQKLKKHLDRLKGLQKVLSK